MQKLFINFILLLSCLASAQNLKITYDYAVKSGDALSHQNAVLYVAKDKSYFYSEVQYKTDSILKVREQKAAGTGQRISFRNLPEGGLVYFLIKDNSQHEVSFFSNEFRKNLQYNEKNNFSWNVKYKEIKYLVGYKLRKASIEKYGKKFIAWYCPSLPINDGPYKFYGLPGLIFELYDTNNIHHFTLKAIQKEKVNVDFLTNNGQDYILTTKEKYSKYREQFKKDPFRWIKNMMHKTGIYKVPSRKTGKMIDMRERIKEIETRLIEKYKNEHQIE